MKKILIVSLLLVFSFPLFAETIVSGNISNQEWTQEGNPYILNGICEVDNGSSLYIGPGVIIRGNPDGNLKINGSLLAEGTADNPILMTENVEGAMWCGILVPVLGDGAIFRYVTMEHSHTNDVRQNGGAINIYNGTLEISHCTFRYNYTEHNSAVLYTYYTDYQIDHCVFHDNRSYNVGAVWGSAEGCSGTFEYNLLYNNYSGNQGTIWLNVGDHHIDHCTLVNNNARLTYPEIYCYSGTTVSNTIIWDTVFQNGPLTNNNLESFTYSTITYGYEGYPTINHENPRFVDISGHNFHLQADSPCINSGDPEYPVDLDGSITDQGAIPFSGESPEGDFHFSIPELPAIAGQTSYIPVVCEFNDEYEIFSLEGTLLFPEGLGEGIASVSIVEGGPLEEWGEGSLQFSVSNDTLYFAAAGATALETDGPLFQIEASIPSFWPTGNYPVVWLDAVCNEGDPEASHHYGILHVVNPPLGDVSINGTVQAFDASLILQYLLDGIELTEIQQQLGEVSGDGNLTVEDASLILQFVANTIDDFPIASGYNVPFVERPEITGEYNINDNRISLPVPVGEYEKINSIEVHYNYDSSIFSFDGIIEENDNRYSTYYQETEDGLTLYIVTNEAFIENEEIEVSLILQVDESIFSGESVTVSEIIYNCYSDFQNIGEYIITSSSVNNPSSDLPVSSRISAIYPNPFNAMTTIRFTLDGTQKVEINVFNTMGQKIASLLDTTMTQGEHEISWNAENVSSGTYFIKCKLGNRNQVRRISLVR